VAYIHDDSIVKSARSTLSNVDFYRQRDCYILASKYGDPQCIRLWNDFAADPATEALAQLVVADVADDARRSAAAKRDLDPVLAKAEARARKRKRKRNVAKPDKKRQREIAEADFHAAQRPFAEYLSKNAAAPDRDTPSLYDSDPIRREWAWRREHGQ
jgi:hypothetical protein